MERLIIEKAKGGKIPCIAEIPEGCGKIIIVVHGISSSKESGNAARLMDYFPGKGIGVMAYDQPGHGHEEAAGDALRVEACLDSLAAVEAYLLERYPGVELCYFGSSFGAYILGLYLVKRPHSGKTAFMRCAAVIFSQMVLGALAQEKDPKALAALQEKGYVDVNMGGEKPARFTLGFFEDMRQNDLLALYDKGLPKDVRFQFIHGDADPVVPVKAVKAFADKHGLPITLVPGEDHSICRQPGSFALTAQLAEGLFCENGR